MYCSPLHSKHVPGAQTPNGSLYRLQTPNGSHHIHANPYQLQSPLQPQLQLQASSSSHPVSALPPFSSLFPPSAPPFPTSVSPNYRLHPLARPTLPVLTRPTLPKLTRFSPALERTPPSVTRTPLPKTPSPRTGSDSLSAFASLTTSLDFSSLCSTRARETNAMELLDRFFGTGSNPLFDGLFQLKTRLRAHLDGVAPSHQMVRDPRSQFRKFVTDSAPEELQCLSMELALLSRLVREVEQLRASYLDETLLQSMGSVSGMSSARSSVVPQRTGSVPDVPRTALLNTPVPFHLPSIRPSPKQLVPSPLPRALQSLPKSPPSLVESPTKRGCEKSEILPHQPPIKKHKSAKLKRSRTKSSGSGGPKVSKCSNCSVRDTPEWRKGPMGSRTVCNACGLFYSKLHKKFGTKDAATIFYFRSATDVTNRVVPTEEEKDEILFAAGSASRNV